MPEPAVKLKLSQSVTRGSHEMQLLEVHGESVPTQSGSNVERMGIGIATNT